MQTHRPPGKVNDADAEVRYGAAKDAGLSYRHHPVLGLAPRWPNGILVPNSELGHLKANDGKPASSAKRKKTRMGQALLTIRTSNCSLV